jgi:hypothetical protein
MQDYYPHAIRVPGHDAGPYTGGAPKIVHHTTEGASYAGALGAFRANNDWPHFTDTFEGGVYRVYQHIPLSLAARSLEHPAGTGETNRDRCIQIEHVGFAAHTPQFAPGYLAGIAALCRFIEEQFGVARAASFPFSVPTVRPERLDWPTFHRYSGHLGHQHVPNQPSGHVDPGHFPIGAVLALPAKRRVPAAA